MEPPVRRRDVLVSVGTCLCVGCLGGGSRTESPAATGSAATASATPTPSVCRSPTTTGNDSAGETPTATASGFEFGPDRETPVILRNRSDRRIEIRLQLVCEPSSEPIYEGAYSLESGARIEALDLAAATVAGSGATITVRVTARGQTRSVTVETTDCGEVRGDVTEEGTVDVWASAC